MQTTNPSMEKKVVGSASGSELDCPICFNKYEPFIRKPKLLTCQHCFCAICLKIMVSLKDGSWVVSCPLCRRFTLVLDALISNLPDNTSLMELLPRRMSAFPESIPEVVLSPHLLLQTRPSTFTLLTHINNSNSSADNEDERLRIRVTASAIRRFLVTMVFFLILLYGLQYFFRNSTMIWILGIMTVLCALTGLVLLYITCQNTRSGESRRNWNPLSFLSCR
ncbi:E3 ubiquitin-protein ligase RNF186-like [Pristis pectinata]|uniref:E3 ubiquitin-protein ligase RNF186-like n=1 Tax=Pristis pectinata TaxID=685728 RepID=UPI00223DA291|nr:E3 ubiquitin-protein ligase RNF186-like [Pristis pectinata]